MTCSASDTHGNTATGGFSVTVRDTTPPALTLPSTIAVYATSPSGAVVLYTVTASDVVSGLVTPMCSPASGATFAIGTTGVNCTATDGAGNSASGTFVVQVNGASEQLADFAVLVTGIGSGNSLKSKVQAAQSAVAAGDPSSACDALNALINEARAQAGKSLTAAQANAIIAAANQIKAVLGC